MVMPTLQDRVAVMGDGKPKRKWVKKSINANPRKAVKHKSISVSERKDRWYGKDKKD